MYRRSAKTLFRALPALFFAFGRVSAQSYSTFAQATAAVTSDRAGGDIQPWQSTFTAGQQFGPASSPLGSTLSSEAINPGGTYLSFVMDSHASADLGSGSLHVESHITNSEFDSDLFGNAFAEAGFGDSFSAVAFDGTPYKYGDGVAQFSMTLDGTATTSFSDTYSLYTVGLYILPKGTLLDDNDGLHVTASWTAGKDGVLGENGPDLGLGLGASYFGSLDTGLTLQFGFVPTGDFDWYMVLFALGGVQLVGSADVDLGHTLQAQYEGPVGSYTESASGVFPGSIPIGTVSTTATPEPDEFLLLLTGMTGLVGLRRIRQFKLVHIFNRFTLRRRSI